MQSTPKGFRLHVGIFGRRNVGKSSLLNAITKQQVSIVSDVAGTTTDPVEKPMELLPLGPVLLIDTAGVDDLGALGELRVEKTQQILDRVDIGIILTEADKWSEFEEKILSELQVRQVPVIVALNKIDICLSLANDVIAKRISKCAVTHAAENQAQEQLKIKIVQLSTKVGVGLDDLRQALLDMVPDDFINAPAIVRDLVAKGDLTILVTPIDKEAPKGRLILPEVQAIRDILDGDGYCIVTQQTQLQRALQNLKEPPKLVITDSQCFAEVAAITPTQIPLTSFSILFARFKGDLITQTEGAVAIDQLKAGDKVLICEACTHHPIHDDIGRVKIPKLLQKYVGGTLDITVISGHDFPQNLRDYKLIVHCGACMWNRREILSRILYCRKMGVPITNYGLTIAHCLKILPRALSCFPAAAAAYRQAHEN